METPNSDISTPCVGSHWFMYAGELPDGKLPDGWLCQCGTTRYSRRHAILDEIDALKRELEEVEA